MADRRRFVYRVDEARRGALAGLARTTGLEATSHGFNVTGWSRHAPTPPATGLGTVPDTYNTFYYGKREGRDEEEGKGEGKGKIDGRDT
jgi:hypothetical protein